MPSAEAAFLAMQFLAQSSHYHRAFAGSSYDVIELDGRPVGRASCIEEPDDIRVVDIGLMPPSTEARELAAPC